MPSHRAKPPAPLPEPGPVLDLLYTDAGGAGLNLATGRRGAVTGSLGWGTSRHGRARSWLTPIGNDAYERHAHAAFDPARPFSVEILFTPRSFQPYSPYISALWTSDQAGAAVDFRLGDGAIPNNSVQVVIGSVKLNSARLLAAGVPAHAVATYDGQTARIYLDGVLDAAGAVGASAAAAFTSSVVGKDSSSGGLRSPDVLVDLVKLHARCLSAAEVAERAADPFARNRPRAASSAFLAAAAPAAPPPDPGPATPAALLLMH